MKTELRERIGKRVELLMEAKGFSSRKKFVRYLNGEISASSLSNVIRGKYVSDRNIECIANGLEIPLEYLICDFETELDGWLKEFKNNEFLEWMEVDSESIVEYTDEDINLEIEPNDTIKFDVKFINECMSEDRNFQYWRLKNPISNALEMFIYQPLIDSSLCSDSLKRIYDSRNHGMNYILEQFRFLYEMIPNTGAKRFADNYCLQYRIREGLAVDKDKASELEKYWNSIEAKKDRQEYEERSGVNLNHSYVL